MNKPEVHFQSIHATGNIYFILFLVHKELQKQDRLPEYYEIKDRVFHAGSYSEALAIIRETVNLIDDDGIY